MSAAQVSPGQEVHTTLVRANARAWGVATGLLAALGVFAATNVLVLKGGDDVGSHLGRLGNLFPGYDVTFAGSLVGAIYGFVVGYAVGRILCPRKPLERDQSMALAGRKHVRINGGSWGRTIGILLGLVLFVTTNVLVMRGGDDVGALLGTLGVYFPGYDVSFVGSLIGAAYLFVLGYLGGRIVGAVYNVTVERAEA